MGAETLEFVFFCIEEVARELGLTGNEVYDLLTQKSGILFQYIVPAYDVLHTQGREAIVEDIVSLMHKEGVLPS